MSDTLDDAKAVQMVEAAQQMIEVWQRLPADRQATLLERFGTRENALAALVATKLVTTDPR